MSFNFRINRSLNYVLFFILQWLLIKHLGLNDMLFLNWIFLCLPDILRKRSCLFILWKLLRIYWRLDVIFLCWSSFDTSGSFTDYLFLSCKFLLSVWYIYWLFIFWFFTLFICGLSFLRNKQTQTFLTTFLLKAGIKFGHLFFTCLWCWFFILANWGLLRLRVLQNTLRFQLLNMNGLIFNKITSILLHKRFTLRISVTNILLLLYHFLWLDECHSSRRGLWAAQKISTRCLFDYSVLTKTTLFFNQI